MASVAKCPLRSCQRSLEAAKLWTRREFEIGEELVADLLLVVRVREGEVVVRDVALGELAQPFIQASECIEVTLTFRFELTQGVDYRKRERSDVKRQRVGAEPFDQLRSRSGKLIILQGDSRCRTPAVRPIGDRRPG